MNCSEEEVMELVNKYWEREFKKIQNIDFPKLREKEIEVSSLINEVETLRTRELSWKANSKLVPYFHPSLKYANKNGKLSPYEYWQKLKTDETLFKKFYKNRLKSSDYFKESEEKNKLLWEGIVPEFIYGIGLTTSGFAPKVSIFKPGAATHLIRKYLQEFDTIFDPCAGYSARMIGTVCMGKKYIGRDLNDLTVSESLKCAEFLKTQIEGAQVELKVADSTTEKGEYPCLLTCPPYSAKEEWRNTKGEKITSKLSCDDWIDTILNNYKCKKYVIVVDGAPTKYKDNIAEVFTNTNYINARNGALTNASYNSENVVVIEK